MATSSGKRLRRGREQAAKGPGLWKRPFPARYSTGTLPCLDGGVIVAANEPGMCRLVSGGWTKPGGAVAQKLPVLQRVMVGVPATRYAKSGDVQVAYQVTGTGPVDLVWAPGTASHLDLDWEWQAKARFLARLGAFSRLIRFDKRGTGLSDRPNRVASLEERTDDIRAVMDAAGSKQAAIFGMSEGSSMACVFAASY